jgi:hypothetical protein
LLGIPSRNRPSCSLDRPVLRPVLRPGETSSARRIRPPPARVATATAAKHRLLRSLGRHLVQRSNGLQGARGVPCPSNCLILSFPIEASSLPRVLGNTHGLFALPFIHSRAEGKASAGVPYRQSQSQTYRGHILRSMSLIYRQFDRSPWWREAARFHACRELLPLGRVGCRARVIL